MDLIKEQKEICDRFGAPYLEASPIFKVGISLNVKDGVMPINGLRHPVEGDTTGWYIWAGEYSEDPDFFVPLHASHLKEWCPLAVKFLGLAPGWRFLATDNYVDVWEDLTLLEV
jgi:hypothetical protein